MRGRAPQPLRSPPAHRRQRRRRHTSPEQLPRTSDSRRSGRNCPWRSQTATPERRRPYEPDPIPPWGTALASRPRPPAATHDRDAPSRPIGRGSGVRIPDARPARPQKPLPTATPRSPHTSEHGSLPVRGLNTAQRLALVARLTLGFVSRLATKALRATSRSRLLQTVARRSASAIAAVQTETAFQLTYPLPKPSVLQLKTRDLLSGSLGPGHPQWVKRFGTTHGVVDSFQTPDQPPTTQTSWAVTRFPAYP